MLGTVMAVPARAFGRPAGSAVDLRLTSAADGN